MSAIVLPRFGSFPVVLCAFCGFFHGAFSKRVLFQQNHKLRMKKCAWKDELGNETVLYSKKDAFCAKKKTICGQILQL